MRCSTRTHGIANIVRSVPLSILRSYRCTRIVPREDSNLGDASFDDEKGDLSPIKDARFGGATSWTGTILCHRISRHCDQFVSSPHVYPSALLHCQVKKEGLGCFSKFDFIPVASET